MGRIGFRGGHRVGRSLSVAMLIQEYYPHVGGAEQQIAKLAPRLQALGIDLTVITRRYGNLKSFEEIGDVPVYRVFVPGSRSLRSISYSLNALALIRLMQPNIVHAHGLQSPATTAALAKRLFHVPSVAKSLRGGSLGDVSRIKSSRLSQRRIRFLSKHIDNFISISNEIDCEFEDIGIPQIKRYFIPNGVDIDRFTPLPTNQRIEVVRDLGLEDGLHAVFAGRFVPEKNLDLLVRAWSDVRKRIPQAKLLLIGSGEEENKLKSLAGNGVEFVGRVDNVLTYLQVADLFLLPSSAEGLSNALLEAMSVGLPIISTNVGGAADLITNGENGWLIQPDSSKELVDSVVSVFSDQQNSRNVGLKARMTVTQSYSLDLVADQLSKLYHGLL